MSDYIKREAQPEYIDKDAWRVEFMDTVYAILADDPTNDRANQIIDLYDDAPAAPVIPIDWIEAQVDKGKWAELVQRWRESNE